MPTESKDFRFGVGRLNGFPSDRAGVVEHEDLRARRPTARPRNAILSLSGKLLLFLDAALPPVPASCSH